MSENREIVLFQNIRQVIKAERWCVENKMEVKVIPVPKPYSTECGMCIELNKEDADRLEVFAEESGMVARRITASN
jgi:hypothetical protein